jgi:hypothetical protein
MCLVTKHCEKGKIFFLVYQGETIEDFEQYRPLRKSTRMLEQDFISKKLIHTLRRYILDNPNDKSDFPAIFKSNDFGKILEMGRVLGKYSHPELTKTDLTYDYCSCESGVSLRDSEQNYKNNKDKNHEQKK